MLPPITPGAEVSWFRCRGICSGIVARVYRGTLLIRKTHPPQDHHKSLGIGLLQGNTGGGVLMSEVPLLVGGPRPPRHPQGFQEEEVYSASPPRGNEGL